MHNGSACCYDRPLDNTMERLGMIVTANNHIITSFQYVGFLARETLSPEIQSQAESIHSPLTFALLNIDAAAGQSSVSTLSLYR